MTCMKKKKVSSCILKKRNLEGQHGTDFLATATAQENEIHCPERLNDVDPEPVAKVDPRLGPSYLDTPPPATRPRKMQM